MFGLSEERDESAEKKARRIDGTSLVSPKADDSLDVAVVVVVIDSTGRVAGLRPQVARAVARRAERDRNILHKKKSKMQRRTPMNVEKWSRKMMI